MFNGRVLRCETFSQINNTMTHECATTLFNDERDWASSQTAARRRVAAQRRPQRAPPTTTMPPPKTTTLTMTMTWHYYYYYYRAMTWRQRRASASLLCAASRATPTARCARCAPPRTALRWRGCTPRLAMHIAASHLLLARRTATCV
jgi:hypothetical protein